VGQLTMVNGRRWSREEDTMLRELAGKVPAKAIGDLLCRPVNGVHHRIHKLGLTGYITGENHWASKIDNLTAGMIGALYDAGYAPVEIQRVLSHPITLNRNYVGEICRCRARINPAA